MTRMFMTTVRIVAVTLISLWPAVVPAHAAEADEAELARKLNEELERVRQLAAELQAIETAPLPTAAPAAKPAPPKQTPTNLEMPIQSVAGAEEEFANALYALGKYEQARKAYERVAESKPKAETLAWARLQMGHCSRRSGDLAGAMAAYEQAISEAPQTRWAKEAEWWVGQVNWRLRWNETMRREGNAANPAP